VAPSFNNELVAPKSGSKQVHFRPTSFVKIRCLLRLFARVHYAPQMCPDQPKSIFRWSINLRISGSIRRTGLVIVTLAVIGCSEMQQPPMTPAQADIYNNCMRTHWSSLADSALFGVAGYEYHQNQVLNCQQLALLRQQDQAVVTPSVISATMPPKAN
jgi:hypothetical protein